MGRMRTSAPHPGNSGMWTDVGEGPGCGKGLSSIPSDKTAKSVTNACAPAPENLLAELTRRLANSNG